MLGISWGIISVVVLLAYGDGFRRRARRRLPRRVLRRHGRSSFPGQTSLQAGGERAGKRVRVTVDDVLAIGRAAAGQERQPGVHAASSRSSTATSSRAIWFAASRPAYGVDAQREAAAGRTLPRRRRRAAAPARRVHRQRSAAQAVRRHSAGRRDDPHRRPAVRDRRRDGGESAAVELQPAGQVLRLHSVDDDGRAVGQRVRRHVRLAGGVAAARAEGDASRCASSSRSAIATTRPTSARSTCSGPRKTQRDHRRHRQRAEAGADVHRRADARDRRRRHHEHHVRQRAGAHARDRRPQGARRDAAREILLQFLLEGLATTFAGGVDRHRVSRTVLVWLLSPRPFLAELLDDASRRDRHPPRAVAAAGRDHARRS